MPNWISASVDILYLQRSSLLLQLGLIQLFNFADYFLDFEYLEALTQFSKYALRRWLTRIQNENGYKNDQ